MSDKFIAAEPMSDNLALRTIIGGLTEINDSLIKRYDSIESSGSIALGALATHTRAAAANAVRTVITNISSSPSTSLRIYEGGVIVGVITQNQTWESPTDGSGEITIESIDGTSTAVIATFLKE